MVESSLLATTSDDPVADVFRGLERYEPVLTQMRQGASRPRSRLDGEWEKGLDAAIWRMGNVMSIGQIVSLRVSALLAKGRGREALLDWRAGYRHAGVFQGEPTLLACMIRVMLVTISTESIHRGLLARRWSEEELVSISEDLASIDLMADFTLGMSSERAFVNLTLERMKDTPGVFTALQIGNPAKPPKWSWDGLIPRGWFAQIVAGQNAAGLAAGGGGRCEIWHDSATAPRHQNRRFKWANSAASSARSRSRFDSGR